MNGPRAELLRLAYGAQVAQVIYVAARVGLSDLLKDGPRTAEDLAMIVGVDVSALRRILRALMSTGVLAEAVGARFALTDMRQYLCADRTDSLQPRVLFNTESDRSSAGQSART